MTKSNSTKSTPSVKPERPEGSPLFFHATGRWAKKIGGKFHYFGRASHAEALALYESQKDELHAGQVLEEKPEGLTVYWLCYEFLVAKKDQHNAGELAARTYADYQAVCKLLCRKLGKTRLVSDLKPSDFAKLRSLMTKPKDKGGLQWGPVRVANVVQRIRTVFKWAFDSRRIKEPVWFGPDFKRPSKKTLRLEKAKRQPKLFTAEEIRRLLGAAGVQLRAMILLSVNAGFGNADCGTLPLSRLNLETGWVCFPRPKTGVDRRACLWPETIAAIQEALAQRPKPENEEDAALVFITKYGKSWFKEAPGGPISHEFGKLLRKLKINGRKGLGFYSLRHSFRTIAGETTDERAIDKIMGHSRDDMGSTYTERISDDRLRRVVQHVRAWLFDEANGSSIQSV
jgi:integrase